MMKLIKTLGTKLEEKAETLNEFNRQNKVKPEQHMNSTHEDAETKKIAELIQSLRESIEFFETTLVKNKADLDLITLQKYQENLLILKDKHQQLKVIGNELQIKRM